MIKNLKLLRGKMGISQQHLANVLGVSQQSINKYENHDVEPDINTLIAMADYFDTSIDYLVGHYNTQEVSEIKLKNNEVSVLRKYRKLNTEQKICVDTLINTLKNNH